MPQTVATAFKWTGNFYNSQYNTSFEVTFSDNDGSYEGGADSDEKVSIDGGPLLSTAGQPYCIDVSFKDVDGNDHIETFDFFNAGGDWYFIPGPDSEFTEGATLGTYQSHTLGWDYSDVVCFAGGTLILTDRGNQPVEELSEGHRIWTASGNYKRLKHNLRRDIGTNKLNLNPKLAQVRIEANALGNGTPSKTLWVSRQHRMFVSSVIAERMFGTPDVLVAAIRLVGLPGIQLDMRQSQLSYHHLVFSDHEIVLANGALSESFFPGSQAMNCISEETCEEFKTLFPHWDSDTQPVEPAAFIPSRIRQKKLVFRHARNQKPLLKEKPRQAMSTLAAAPRA